jgi:hypothetical protein
MFAAELWRFWRSSLPGVGALVIQSYLTSEIAWRGRGTG